MEIPISKVVIKKTISTEHGDVISAAELSHTDNGQVLLHVVSQLGDAKHEHRITVGAEDGKDAVSSMSEEELRTSLQTHLDATRNDAAQILGGRAKVGKIVSQLQ
jgi:hypothetical protein